MDDELRDLEKQLQELPPAPPSARLWERIRCDLEPAVPVSGRAHRRLVVLPRAKWWWVALPVAAAVAVLLLTPARHAPAETPPGITGPTPVRAEMASTNVFKPVAVEDVLYASADEGLVTLEDGTPARRERLHFVDTVTWRNPRTNASLTWSVPREEVHVVPVRFQ